MVGFKFLLFGRYFRFNSGAFRFNFTFLIYYYLRHLLLLYSYVVYAGLYIHTTLEDLGFVDNIVILDSGITTAIRHVTVLRENGSTVGLNINFHKTKALFICKVTSKNVIVSCIFFVF